MKSPEYPLIETLDEVVERLAVRDQISVIYDLGSRKLFEAQDLHELFPESEVFCFECDPEILPICRETIQNMPYAKLFEKAVWSHTGKMDFWAFNAQSSAYIHLKPDLIKQTKVEVECVRLEDLINDGTIPPPDLIWMDIQGAEAVALESLGPYLKDTKIIHAEFCMNPLYEGQTLLSDAKEVMGEDFIKISPSYEPEGFFDNFIFANKRYCQWTPTDLTLKSSDSSSQSQV